MTSWDVFGLKKKPFGQKEFKAFFYKIYNVDILYEIVQTVF